MPYIDHSGSTHILISIPEDQVQNFIDHLAKYHPIHAQHITLRVLTEEHAEQIIDDFEQITRDTVRDILNIDFDTPIPDDEWDDDILPLEDLIDMRVLESESIDKEYL